MKLYCMLFFVLEIRIFSGKNWQCIAAVRFVVLTLIPGCCLFYVNGLSL